MQKILEICAALT